MVGGVARNDRKSTKHSRHWEQLEKLLIRTADSPVPLKYNKPTITANYPNPFNPMTTISLYMPKQAIATLSIYNLKGQRVKVLSQGTLRKGNCKVRWDGKDDKGHLVGSGIYFARLSSGKEVSTKKMILLK